MVSGGGGLELEWIRHRLPHPNRIRFNTGWGVNCCDADWGQESELDQGFVMRVRWRAVGMGSRGGGRGDGIGWEGGQVDQ